MEHLYKRFVVWGIAFRRNIFLTARLKLTSLYVLILAIIIGGFSLFLFSSVLQNLKDASEDDFATAASRIHFIEHTQEPIRNTLLLTDGIILLGAAGLSYWLAGRTLKPVQRSLEAQRLFAAQASHELRTPLTVIQSEAEVALRSAHTSPAELREALLSTIEEVQGMSQLVEDLLLLARSEHGKLTLRSSLSFNEIQKQVVSRLTPLAAQKGITLTSDSHGNPHLWANASSIERVFVNVIQNSIEHTDSGGRIMLSSEQKNGSVLFCVTDTGTGIDPEHIPYLFERFYKGGSEKSGSGLGLSIVKEIVAQHGGSIAVESVPHEGTTVTISIPAA